MTAPVRPPSGASHAAPAPSQAPARAKSPSGAPARAAAAGSVAPPPARVPSAPPRNLSPSHQTAVGKPIPPPGELGAPAITARAKAIEEEEPFITLGVRETASVEEVRAAYLRAVKTWHPDRLPAELAAVRDDVGKIFAQMTQANHTLTDPEARRAYLAARAERHALMNRPRPEVLRLIDMALGKKDWSFATDEAKKLVNRDTEDSEAQAVLAWASCAGAEGAEALVRAALPLLDRAVNRDTQCVRAHFYRGMVNRRLGNLQHAYRDFARTVALDPKHVDATREVRIYEMRMKNK
jgi:curved DNA-binding protein CbpA